MKIEIWWLADIAKTLFSFVSGIILLEKYLSDVQTLDRLEIALKYPRGQRW